MGEEGLGVEEEEEMGKGGAKERGEERRKEGREGGREGGM